MRDATTLRVLVHCPARGVAVEEGDLLLRFFLRSETRRSPSLASPASDAPYHAVKRLLDVVAAALLIGLTLPIWLVVAAAVAVSSPGPILFRQRRLGRGGREFWCWKFRTMRTDAEQILAQDAALRAEFEASFKLDDDPRVTPIGGLLRRTSLDELPQLLNVLAGDMTMIGPRPIVPRELSKYGEHGEKLLTVRPGLGGLWQVCGRSDTTYPERVRMDMAYVDHCSLGLDLYLMLQTASAVVRRSGAR